MLCQKTEITTNATIPPGKAEISRLINSIYYFNEPDLVNAINIILIAFLLLLIFIEIFV